MDASTKINSVVDRFYDFPEEIKMAGLSLLSKWDQLSPFT